MADPEKMRREFGPRGIERFRDAGGENLFSEKNSVPEHLAANDENLFAAANAGDGPSYRPNEFVATLPTRASKILRLGVAGFTLSLLGIPFTLCSLPVVVLPALCFSIPAWIMGAHDLPAIRAGAMSSEALKRTRRGYWLGIFGTVLGIAEVVGWFAMVGLGWMLDI